MLLQDVEGHPDPLIASNGDKNGPPSYVLSAETSGFIGMRMTFRRAVYDCHRQEATGDSSHNRAANQRRTSAASHINVTRNSHKHDRGYYGINDGRPGEVI